MVRVADLVSMGMDAPTREHFSLSGTAETETNISWKSREDDQLRLDFQAVVKRYARKGMLYASQETLVQALKNQYPLITTYVVERLIKQDKTLMRIGQYRKGVHGTPYLLLSSPSRSSVARRKAVALRFLLSLVEKRKKAQNVSEPHVETRYGAHHRAVRHNFQAKLMSAGFLPCARCGKAIKHTDRWHLDHVDGSDTLYAGISHPFCNRKHQLKARLASWFKPTFLSPDLVDIR